MMRKSSFISIGLLFGLSLFFPFVIAGQATIEGQYRFIDEQPSGMTPVTGGEILLSVSSRGEMSIAAKKPGDVLTTRGTFRLHGQRIALDFPELGKSVSDGPWKFTGGILVLPLQFIDEGPGTSRWQRITPGSGPIQLFFDVLNRGFHQGVKAEAAARSAAEEAKRFSLTTPGNDQSTRIKSYLLWSGGGGCTLEFEDGHQEAVLTETASVAEVSAHKQLIGMMARDPRTHIPSQPHTAPDDPKSKSAILFAPFDTTPYFAMSWQYEGAPEQTVMARVSSHKEEGEDLDYIRKKLEERNYDVKILRNDEATPLALHDSILKHPPAPGVIYFSTHGGAWEMEESEGSFDNIIVLISGVCLGPVDKEWEVHKNSEEVREIIRRSVPKGYSEGETQIGFVGSTVMATWSQSIEGLPVSYLGITNYFFAKIQDEGADFSTSFFYANGCYTVKNSALIECLGAKMVLGNREGARAYPMFAQARWIFGRLAKRTFSLREVIGLLHHIVKTNVEIFPEDGWLARVDPWDNYNLTLYGSDGRIAEIPSFDVLYLCWLARWDAKNPEEGSQALEKTYNEFWQKEHFSRLKSPFANAGVRGSHVPKKRGGGVCHAPRIRDSHTTRRPFHAQ